ncbi:glycosyltransferase family 2 protein [Maricaulis sp.]|uniref:glycosyltransferase family 2 protein n=1 Tax=Maricaulis sp. TaxID=1486257 RepID=UPI001B2E6745|nr:glycosyltransferase family 2 protein [Maricaulis sp.]MBO6796530.1 glycosyltransferase family 2 protein [Maricaulis sp.]
MTQAATEFSVLIVAYRSQGTIDRCLDALARQTVRPAQVLLLENGSPHGERLDETTLPDWVQFIASDENLGFAGGNNKLAREVICEWVVLLNPDAYPHPDWLEQIEKATRRMPDVNLFGSTQYVADQDGVFDGCGDVYHAAGLAYRAEYGKRLTAPPPTGRVFAGCGAALAVRRQTWDALGGFDEHFFCYNEDVDLGYRARLLGWHTVQLADAKVDHLGYGSSGRRSEFATYYGVRNRLWVFLRNTPGWGLILLAPGHVLATLALWLSAARFGQFRLFGRAIRDGLRDWPRIRRERKALQAQRTVSVRDVLSAMTWNPLALLTRASDTRPL